MLVANFSYIVVDPEIDVSILSRSMKSPRILEYSFQKTFLAHATMAARMRGTIIVAKCRSEDFIRRAKITGDMSRRGIPAIFSFSISFHATVIAMLKSEGISTFGCGYVHDGMGARQPLVGQGHVTMTYERGATARDDMVLASFGKSTYREPYLRKDTVEGLVLMRDAMPEVWSNVDTGTRAIMGRAVLLRG